MNRLFRRSIHLAACLLLAGATEAQTQDQAVAEQLFRDARKLMDEKKFAEACPKFEASQRLGPALGTLLNLAVCHEAEGKVASAWGEFSQVAALSKREGRKDREDFAREHMAALEARLPKLAISVPAKTRVAGLEVTRNGQAVLEATLSSSLPIDPGVWLIEARAPGKKPWKKEISIKEKESLTVEVPPLEDAPAAPAAPPASASASASGGAQAASSPPAASTSTGRTAGASSRTTGLILGGVGVVSLGFGAFMGLRAFSKRSQSDDACPVLAGVERCSQEGATLNDEARSSAKLSNLGFGLGAVLLGAGVYLVATSPAQEQTSGARGPRWRPDVAVTPGGVLASMSGRF